MPVTCSTCGATEGDGQNQCGFVFGGDHAETDMWSADWSERALMAEGRIAKLEKEYERIIANIQTKQEENHMAERVVQQHLIMTTHGHNLLRSKAVGWSAEDPTRFKPGGGHANIGLTPGFKDPYCYTTPMAALADGWRLLAPPDKTQPLCEWWFVREVVTDTSAPGVT